MTEPRSRVYENREGKGFRRKTVPVWPDQWDDLGPPARELQDAKDPRAPRITENTLIRVAIDVLLEHSELLAGNTEDEIRANLLAVLRGR